MCIRDRINALSTSVIAFITGLGLMVGFYFNLKASNTKLSYIITLELLFVVAVWLFISWVKGGMENEWYHKLDLKELEDNFSNNNYNLFAFKNTNIIKKLKMLHISEREVELPEAVISKL